jgi:hypothetical protein
MDAELVLFACVPATATLATFWLFHRPRAGAATAVLVFAGGLLAGASIQANLAVDQSDVDLRPIAVTDDEYVSSDTCRSCHPEQYNTWSASYHRTMTQLATPEAVQGDFDDAVIEYLGQKHYFRREGDRFVVELQVNPGSVMASKLEADGLPSDHLRLPVTMTTGSHHMQVYWSPTDQGRNLRQVPFVYLLPEQRWVPRDAIFLQPPSQAPPADETGRWNYGCIRCHVTQGKPREDDAGRLDTHVAEFGISCESCHGPAGQHVRTNRDPVRRYRLHVGDAVDNTITNPRRLSARASSQICGQCHGVWDFMGVEKDIAEWNAHGYPYRPGDELTNTRKMIQSSQRPVTETVRTLVENDATYVLDRFWSDGMVRVSGREYNGLIDTPCHQRGELSCLSCHTMHQPDDDPRSREEWANDQLILGMDGNKACNQCHTDFADSQKLVAHTHHPANSQGSQCYNCHMPYTTYGLLKAIRSHQIDSPSVATSVNTGRPNACNACHLDRSLAWAAGNLSEWYGIPEPELDQDQKTIAASLLWMIRGDAGQRALMTWAMGWESTWEASGNKWMIPFLAPLLDDPYDAVRLLTSRTMRKLLGDEPWEYDFLAPSAERVEAGKQAVDIWNERREKDGPSEFPAGVQAAAGAFSRLLQHRDNHDVQLAE